MALRSIRVLARANLPSLLRQQSTNAAAAMEAARPWEDIPSPPWVPIVGNLALAFRCILFNLPVE